MCGGHTGIHTFMSVLVRVCVHEEASDFTQA